jgi:hypothetical protein
VKRRQLSVALITAASAAALLPAGSVGAPSGPGVRTLLLTRRPIFAFAQGGRDVTWIPRQAPGQETGCAMHVRALDGHRTAIYPLPSCAVLLRGAPLALADGEAAWSTDYNNCPTFSCEWKVVGISANPRHHRFRYSVSVPCIGYPDECSTETGTGPIVAASGTLLAYNAGGMGQAQDGLGRERVDVLVGGRSRRLSAVPGVIQGLHVGGGVIQTVNQVCSPSCGTRTGGVELFSAAGKPLAHLPGLPVVLAGKIAAVASQQIGGIALFNPFTGTQLATLPIGDAKGNVSLIGGDSQWVAFHIGRALSALNVNSLQIVLLTTTARTPLDISVSGHRVTWAENINGRGRVRAVELPN